MGCNSVNLFLTVYIAGEMSYIRNNLPGAFFVNEMFIKIGELLQF